MYCADSDPPDFETFVFEGVEDAILTALMRRRDFQDHSDHWALGNKDVSRQDVLRTAFATFPPHFLWCMFQEHGFKPHDKFSTNSFLRWQRRPPVSFLHGIAEVGTIKFIVGLEAFYPFRTDVGI